MTRTLTPSGDRFRSTDLTAPWRHVDTVLLGVVVLIVVTGTAMVYSATRNLAGGSGYMVRQGLFVVLGAALMVGISLIDYRRIADWWQVIYGLSLIGMAGIFTPLGAVVNGTKGWYRFGPFSLQPAEFAKLGVILAVAAYLSQSDRVDLRRLAVALGLFGVPTVMTLLQPDLGSALVFIVIALGMLVVGGVQMRHLLVLVALGLVAVLGILNSGTLDQYQKYRLTSFVTPDGQSYNVSQAQQAIGSGGLTGYGFTKGPQTRGGYVPEQETDFIFTVAGEELGFVGAGALVVLLGLMVWRVWRNAQLAGDTLGTLICVGIMPVTGIPLPFVSYGGSSMMTSFAAVGLVQSVHMHRYA